ncbi:MAG TPA: sugar kinase [Candidatus Dormibacteraeota bacterium]|nr:sugar kinase [Candidatus Dormibacteraeota bacterium]
MNPGPRFQVTTLGEAMLRFSVRPGDRISDAPAYQIHVAGSEANVAHALARVGLAASWASVLPRNPLAERIASTLRSGGVDLSTVVWTERGRVGTYFVELAVPPRPTTVVYDRAGSTMAVATPDMFDWDQVCDCRVLHVSGITMGISPQGYDIALTAVREAKARGREVSLDVNYRSSLWTKEEASDALRALSGQIDILICKADDARDLFGCGGETKEIAGSLQEIFQSPRVVVTRGPLPSVAMAGDLCWERPSHQVRIIDRIGAGDAFAAGVLWGHLEGSLGHGLEWGAAMAALKMTLHGDLFTLDRDAVEGLLDQQGRDIQR